MWTRGDLQRNWGVHDDGITVAPEVAPARPAVIRGGPVSLNLPAVNTPMDPSDPRTWRRPVRFT